MHRNSSVNNIIVTWLCDSSAFLFCVVPIVMLLMLSPKSAQAGCKSSYHHSSRDDTCILNDDGFFTQKQLHIVADMDSSSNNEDILFGFDSDRKETMTEKMRLTDEGRLGIGTPRPDAILDVRAISIQNYSLETTGKTVARFGSTTYPSANNPDRANYYGLKLKVHSHRSYVPNGIAYMKTRVGFNLATAESSLSSGSNGYLNPELGSDRQMHYFEKRALTMEYDPNWPTPRVAIGFADENDYHPRQTLDVNGAVRIGNTSNSDAGTIRFAGGVFQGYDGDDWLNLGHGNGAGHDLVLGAENSIVFGTVTENRNQDLFIVNSVNAPRDDVAHFPVPSEGNSYNNDDDGTSGGLSLVTNGLPRFTVKGNGNTYVHKRLSIGVGGYVTDTVLTVAGAVHIGPDNVQPTEFDYGDEIGDYLLWVERGIVSEDFAIANTDNWSDHVLQDDYDLKPLSEVETFIQEEGHLPGVPSAEQVKNNGYTVHNMTRTLLEKVEELTLHTIAQQKALEAQQTEIVTLRAQLNRVDQPKREFKSHVKTSF